MRSKTAAGAVFRSRTAADRQPPGTQPAAVRHSCASRSSEHWVTSDRYWLDSVSCGLHEWWHVPNVAGRRAEHENESEKDGDSHSDNCSGESQSCGSSSEEGSVEEDGGPREPPPGGEGARARARRRGASSSTRGAGADAGARAGGAPASAATPAEIREALGNFHVFSFLEPHKMYQNSFTILQKRDAYSEPIFTVFP